MINGKTILARKWLIIVASLALLFITGSGARFLEIQTDNRVFFGPNNPQIKAMEAFEEVYTKNVNVLFVLEPKGGNVFTRETLSAIEELTRDSWQIPYSSRVDSITNFQHMRADGDDLIVEDLVTEPMRLTDGELKRKKEFALSEPLLVNRIISPTGHVTGVNVLITKPDKSPDEVTEITMYVREMAEKLKRRYPHLNVYLSGGVPFDNAFAEVSMDDMANLMPVMFAVMIAIVALALRSISGTVVTVFVIIASTGTAMGLMGWLGLMISPASAIAPTIILTLAIADSIHILSTMFHQMRDGKSKYDAIVESLRVNLQPVFLTSVTTAIGFLTMNFSDAPPFHDLGNVVAIGIAAAFFYSIFFLPAMMMVMPVGIRVKSRIDGKWKIMESLGDFVVNRRRPLFFAMAGFILLLATGIPRIELEDTFSKYFDERYQIRRDTDFMDKNLTGWNTLEYSIGSGEESGIVKPEYLAQLEKLESWFYKQPKVMNVNSIVGTMKQLNKSMHGDDPAYYKIPADRELAAQYLLLYEMSLPFGLDLNSRINIDKSASRFTVILQDLSTAKMRQIAGVAEEWISQNLPEEMRAQATGESVMWMHIAARNIKAMLGGTLMALVLISGLLIVALRSVKIGLLSLVPNLAPAMMAFGLWGHLVGKIGMAVSVIAAMTFGIVVDDTVHFLSKYLRARREHSASPRQAVRYAFNTVGAALLVTSLVLAAGFFVLSFSGFKVNSSMGLLTSITIVLALMADFLFLPPLLMKLEKES